MILVSNPALLADLPLEDQVANEPEAPPRAPGVASLVTITGRQVLVALRILIAMTVVLGLAYPLLVLGIGQLIAPAKANGSMVTAGGKAVGSSLIGQNFTEPQWFQGRPSAAGADGYDATSSGGSNLSADSDVLLKSVQERRAAVAKADGVDPSAVPVDALTASASGLDPDISPAYANIQVNRVATARKLDPVAVQQLVAAHVSTPLFGFIGQERVNVLALNIALQSMTN
jgi:K+-transporting ATPase ATPase C chain